MTLTIEQLLQLVVSFLGLGVAAGGTIFGAAAVWQFFKDLAADDSGGTEK